MKRLGPILLWSAISAAFIGPGTVTTAAVAGANHGFDLLWALVFSTLACLALQEAAARMTCASGLALGEAIAVRFGRAASWTVVGSVVLGCAAYEAGNVLGAVAGVGLQLPISPVWLTAGIGAVAFAILLSGRPDRVARLMGVAVALMGLAFLACAVRVAPPAGELFGGAFVPSMPPESGALVLGLVGTTVVPYNLFLGSALARGQRLADIRIGLGVAVPLGGLISAAILVAGTTVEGEFGYAALSDALVGNLGRWSGLLFALGLLTAGLSSAVTAPLAAALSLQSLVSKRGERDERRRAWTYRLALIGVLLVGVGFGLAGVKPVPAIILAQALNGVVLPLVAIFLLMATNDRQLLGGSAINGPLANAAIGISCLVALLLGVSGVLRAASSVIGVEPPGQAWIVVVAAVVAVVLAVPVGLRVRRLRAGQRS
ncbi:MAG: Nramp family divalent metal transporter [Deltaproteobacteria bacterium]|nr:Nramp family divalent metal transporter [Deltaproteobacteria bacterium]